jgi:hypothetical protein
MVNQALALADLYADFAPRLETDDANAFAREWRRFLTAAQRYL